MFIQTNDEYKSGFMIDEYNGVYSLVEAKVGSDGAKVFKKWGYVDKSVKGDDGKYHSEPGKKRPWGVELGMKEEAIERLETVLAMLRGEPAGPEMMDDNMVPF